MAGAERVAVTGAGGRLGSAVTAAATARGGQVLAWRRPDYDLDDPTAARRLVERDRPPLVVHAAAWVDVDGCAREPEVARRRNTEATRELAEACAEDGLDLLLVSTNEVFDGDRTDGAGYRETDRPRPANPYGASKLAAEEAAAEAYRRAAGPGRLWIVRTSWLFGPPGNDFPAKIVAAADRLPPGDALPVVADEVGSPTSTTDLARALLDLVERAPQGVYHLVNAGYASRFEWARRVLAECRPDRPLRPISRADFTRASTPPAWGVLETAAAAAVGVSLRTWEDALRDRLPELCR